MTSEWKDTDLGQAPTHWKLKTLESISELITDGAHYSPKPESEGKYMCSVKDMIYNRFDFSSCKLISQSDYDKLVAQGCQPIKGDILISKDGANCLDLIFVFDQEEDVVLLSSIAIVRILPNLNPKFIRYFLLSPACQYFMRNNFISGSAIPRVVLKDFKKVPILFPPLAEQEAITTVLASLDDKINLLHRQNKTLESLAQTIFRHWFVDGEQKDWEKHSLEEFVEVLRGLSYKGAGLAEEGEGVPMHNLNSVYEGGGYKYEGIKYYKGGFKERHKVFPGDIIITNTEQGHELLLIGYPAVVPKYFGKEGIFSQHIYRLQIYDNRITGQFLYYLLMSYDVREQIAGATNGSTVNMLPKDGIEWATFKLPPPELIKQFSKIVQQYWDKQEANYLQVRTLEKLRDVLLPKLMSGEVSVQF